MVPFLSKKRKKAHEVVLRKNRALLTSSFSVQKSRFCLKETAIYFIKIKRKQDLLVF